MNNLFFRHRFLFFGSILVLGVAVFLAFVRPKLPAAPSANKIAAINNFISMGGTSPGPIAHRFNVSSVARPPRELSASDIPPDEDRPSVATVSDRARFVVGVLPGQHKAAEADPGLQNAATGLRDYRKIFHQNPVGTNAEITRTLLGKNSQQARYLPSDPPLNKKGELIDRWGQPISFHQISANVMEIRSAGPDHVMWTSDDAVLR